MPGGAEQGVQRALPAGTGARRGRAEAFRHHPGLSGAGRCPCGVRAWFGGCLGDLGPVPGGGAGCHRGPRADRRHQFGAEPAVLPGHRSADPRQPGIVACGIGRHRPDRPLGAGPPRRGHAAAGRQHGHPPRADRDRARSYGVWRGATDAGGRCRPAEDCRYVSRPRADPGRNRRLQRRLAANFMRNEMTSHEAATADVLWFLPTHGDGRYLGTETGARHVTLGYLGQIARAADELGYFGVLLPTGKSCEDSWVIASAMVPMTQRLRFLVAVRPGLSEPSMTARMAATLDRLSGGRLLVNVVAGGDPTELRGDGVWLDHDERYVATDEYLTIWRRLLAGETVSYSGKHMQIEG